MKMSYFYYNCMNPSLRCPFLKSMRFCKSNTLCHVLPVFLFFSVYHRTRCSVLAEQKDAEDIDSSQLCLVLQEELASYKAKK